MVSSKAGNLPYGVTLFSFAERMVTLTITFSIQFCQNVFAAIECPIQTKYDDDDDDTVIPMKVQ